MKQPNQKFDQNMPHIFKQKIYAFRPGGGVDHDHLENNMPHHGGSQEGANTENNPDIDPKLNRL